MIEINAQIEGGRGSKNSSLHLCVCVFILEAQVYYDNNKITSLNSLHSVLDLKLKGSARGR